MPTCEGRTPGSTAEEDPFTPAQYFDCVIHGADPVGKMIADAEAAGKPLSPERILGLREQHLRLLQEGAILGMRNEMSKIL